MNLLIVGLGNPIFGDDGVGWQIADQVNQYLDPEEAREARIEIDRLSLGGLSLMERMVGFDRVILIDAIHTSTKPLGSVTLLALEDLPDPSSGHTGSAHDTSLQTALSMGRMLGLQLPKEISVVSVETNLDYNFSETLSPHVAAAVPQAAQYVLELVKNH